MRNFYRGIAWSLAVALVLGLAANANAAIVSFNGNVTSTGALYFGNGNTNGGFTIDRESGIGLELGLRAHQRNPDDDSAAGIKNSGNGLYGSFAPVGWGTLNSRASWNFDFSINTNYNTAGTTLAASNFVFLLSVDYDPSVGTNFVTVNALTKFGDNGYGTSASEHGPIGSGGDGLFDPSTDTVAQNSEQLQFSDFLPLSATFNPNTSGIYDIRLTAFNSAGDFVGASAIRVLVGDVSAAPPVQGNVPEPASMAIWGLGALGCAVAGYRRRKHAA